MDIGPIVDLLLTAERLKRLPRTGWLMTTATSHIESIAAHSWSTVLISLLVAKRLREQDVEVDLEKVLVMATIHDLPEARISDIPHTALILPQLGDAKRLGEDLVAEEMLRIMVSDDSLKSIWHEFQRAESCEAQIVHAADLIDMLTHAISLEESGVSPSVLHEFFASCQYLLLNHRIDFLQEMYRELLRRHLENARRLHLSF